MVDAGGHFILQAHFHGEIGDSWVLQKAAFMLLVAKIICATPDFRLELSFFGVYRHSTNGVNLDHMLINNELTHNEFIPEPVSSLAV
nr:hypothetical protein [Methanosarcina acetivorans]